MSRMRGVKPELFKHEGLYDLEAETGLPVRIAFIGLWTVADREGRFRWLPRRLKVDVLPWDGLDFDAVLSALERGGFVRSYEVDGERFGHIPKWSLHQRIPTREPKSQLPCPPNDTEKHCQSTAEALSKQRNSTHEREREREREREYPLPPSGEVSEFSDSQTAGGFEAFWNAYPKPVDKANASRAWNDIDPDPLTQQQILLALARQKLSERWLANDGRWIPHPAAYLRKSLWNDILPAGGSASETPEQRASRILSERQSRERETREARASRAKGTGPK